jgi:hypothetical protein
MLMLKKLMKCIDISNIFNHIPIDTSFGLCHRFGEILLEHGIENESE